MTLPRQNDSNLTAICARTANGREFLVPSKPLNQMILYAMGRACEETESAICSSTWMSNHHHTQLVSKSRTASDWARLCHSLIATMFNYVHVRGTGVWDTDALQVAAVHGRSAALRRVGYGNANPVAAGVARTPGEHLGVCIGPELFGKTLRIKRPDFALPEGTTLPRYVTLKIVAPEGVMREGETVEEFREAALQAVDEAVKEARADLKRQGRGPAGPRRTKKRNAEKIRNKVWLHESPREQEKRRAWRGRSAPAFFASSEEEYRELRRRYEVFLEQYRVAMEAWNENPPLPVEFPYGTLKMASAPNVVVALPPMRL